MNESALEIPATVSVTPRPRERSLRGFFKLCRRLLWRDRFWGKAARQRADRRQRVQAILRHWEEGLCFPSASLRLHPQTPEWKVAVGENWPKLTRTAYEAEKPEENRIKEWISLVSSHTMVTFDGLLSLADQVRYCEQNRLLGAYVETGCNLGGAAALMARASLHYGDGLRSIHVFDSFEGLPQPDAAKDPDAVAMWQIPPDQQQGKMVATGSMLASEDDVREVFRRVGYPASQLHIHKGWFCDTVPPFAARNEPIAILRLDGDLYASTWDVLVQLYPRVVDGGIVVIDDYNVTGARRAVADYLATLARKPYICRADGAVSYFIKQAS